MLGRTGKLIYVDLLKRKTSVESLNQTWAEKYLGGRGLAAKYFFELQRVGTPPLSAENVFIIMTGPFTGTPIPAAQRMEMVTKSPLTGTYLCSSVGGDFPRELKLAGWDGIIITGSSEHPLRLSIQDNEVRINRADDLWGRYCGETQKIIKEEEPGAKVACIGPAGERLVKLASIQCEERSAARGGPGTVWGFKKLKAISVRGTGEVEVAAPEELKEEVLEIYKKVKANPGLRMDKYGTMNQLKLASHFGILPLKNFQSVLLEEEIPAEFDTEYWRSRWVIGDTACPLCPIICGKVAEFSFGSLRAKVEGPEYETIGMFGPSCGVDRMEAVLAANYWCDQLGLDTISTGSTIAFAMECYEKGIINKADTGGVDLSFGNAEAMVELVRKIGNREGLGNTLAEGSAMAAKKFGHQSETFAMQVKGLEYSAYEPRGFWGQALGFGTNVRGGAHNQVFTFYKEVLGKFDRMSPEGKAELVKNVQNERAALDSLQVCIFGSAIYPFDLCSRLYTLVTGEKIDSKELIRRGERTYTLERLINCRDGLSRKDDYPAKRTLEEALPRGFAQGRVIGRQNYDKMLDEFYKIRGWDQAGHPTKEKLLELEIFN